MIDIIKRFSVLSLFLIGAVASTRASFISMPDFVIGCGYSASVELTVQNEGNPMFDYSGWQFDLFLPEGLTVEEFRLDKQLSEQNFMLSITEHGNGAYRIVAFTAGSGAASGELMQLTFHAADNVTREEAKILMQNVVFSAPDGQDIDLQNSDATVTFDTFGVAETPLQLLRKGNGTSCTFICMMPISNEQLVSDGYQFIYGYTSKDGMEQMLSHSSLRYCHTTETIFKDSSLDFWVFAYYIASDGTKYVSSRRHLDGSTDEDFNPVAFINLPHDAVIRAEEGVYTLDGLYLGKDASKVAKGIYILQTDEGSHKFIK